MEHQTRTGTEDGYISLINDLHHPSDHTPHHFPSRQKLTQEKICESGSTEHASGVQENSTSLSNAFENVFNDHRFALGVHDESLYIFNPEQVLTRVGNTPSRGRSPYFNEDYRSFMEELGSMVPPEPLSEGSAIDVDTYCNEDYRSFMEELGSMVPPEPLSEGSAIDVDTYEIEGLITGEFHPALSVAWESPPWRTSQEPAENDKVEEIFDREKKTPSHLHTDSTIEASSELGKAPGGWPHTPFSPPPSPCPSPPTPKSASKTRRRSKSSRRKPSTKTLQSPTALGFVNFTPNDSQKILTGVAPSGSSKTKARREQEANDKKRSMILAAEKTVLDCGGDLKQFRASRFLK